MGVLNNCAYGLLLLSAVALVAIDTIRNRRPGATGWRVVREIPSRPKDWQSIVGGTALIGIAFLLTFSTWCALLALPVYAGFWLHVRNDVARTVKPPVPAPREVLGTPEPTSNMRVL